MKTSFRGALVVVTMATVLAIFVLKKSSGVELRTLIGMLAVFMFGYLLRCSTSASDLIHASKPVFHGPFLNLRLGGMRPRSSIPEERWPKAGAEAVPLGNIIGFLLDFLVSIIIAFIIAVILSLSFSFVVTAVLVVSIPLYFLCRRSIRYIVEKGRSCHSDFWRSLVFALRSTLANIAWFYAILIGAQYIAQFKGLS